MNVDALDQKLDDWSVRYFDGIELLRLTHPDWNGPDVADVPDELVDNIRPTVQLADQVRHMFGGAVEVVSGYRPPEYNALVGGVDDSQHTYFRALDLRPADGDVVKFWSVVSGVVACWRMADEVVGLGIYEDFVHVDVGYRDRRWVG